MDQTPVNEFHNAELLELIPPETSRLVEVGCSSGALAREFRKINPTCHYVGIDIVPSYVELARRHCHVAMAFDIEQVDDQVLDDLRDRQCWVFADTLEHLRDPWRVLSRVRERIPADGFVVACIPNAQHWSMFARLSVGDFRYEPSGLLDRTHLRWFTRQTVLELFSATGFNVVECRPRVFDEPWRERFMAPIGALAAAAGGDPRATILDFLAMQHVVRAVPA